MTKQLLSGFVMCGMITGLASAATTVWNPAANGITPPDTGNWNDAANWTNGVPVAGLGATNPDPIKAVFNVLGAAEALVTTSQLAGQLVQGDNGPGGIIRVVSGGSVTTSAVWTAIGYNDTANLIAETNGTFTFGQHAWIGFNPDGVGTVDIDGGTINVLGMLGLGWSGGTGFVNVNDGGILDLFQMAGGTDSIKGASLLNVTGTGKVTLPNDQTGTFQRYIDAGLILGNGQTDNVSMEVAGGVTTLTANPIPEPSTLSLLSMIGVGTLLFRRRS